jgi:hypothetical protein
MLDVRPQQGSGHDLHGQRIHVRIEANSAAGLPGRDVTGHQVRNQGTIDGQPLPGEHRLNHAPLLPVGYAFAGEQTVAQQSASALHQPALAEVGRSVHEHGAHLIRVGEQDGIGAPEPEAGDISLLLRKAKQEAGAVRVERQGVAEPG